jgi:hypothetical protein
MLFSSGFVKRPFYIFSKKRRGDGGGNSETTSKQSEPTGDGKLYSPICNPEYRRVDEPINWIELGKPKKTDSTRA